MPLPVNLPSDASVMREGDEIRRNMGEMTSIMRAMMARMENQ
jgi:hypothetical protein